MITAIRVLAALRCHCNALHTRVGTVFVAFHRVLDGDETANAVTRYRAGPELLKLVSSEFRTAGGGFTGAVQQLANVATLPGVLAL